MAQANTNMPSPRFIVEMSTDSPTMPFSQIKSPLKVNGDHTAVAGMRNTNPYNLRSRRLQQGMEQGGWSDGQQMAYASTGVHMDPSGYNNMSNASNPYANSGSVLQNLNNTTNFGWDYTPNTFYQTPAPIMNPQWLQMQFAQQTMKTQQMLGAFGGSAFMNNTRGIHQQIRPMSTAVLPRDSVTKQFGMTPEAPPATFAPDATAETNNNAQSTPSVPIKYVRTERPPVEPPQTPLPSAAYLEQANKEPLDLHFMQPLLIILDLNGTLLYRKRKSFPPKFIRRPALDYFLERLTSRHHVMVWSSSRPETVEAICDEIFSEGQKKKLVAKWARNKLGLNPEQYNAKVQVYKELNKIWADEKIQASFPHKKHRAGKAAYNALRYAPGLDELKEMTGFIAKKWDQSNTVLIDDSTLKAAANPYNILQVPEFTNVPNQDDTTVLKELLLKIRVLAKSNDVSRRLRTLGPEGIQIRREDVLSSASSSSGSESESEKSITKGLNFGIRYDEFRKEERETGEPVVGPGEIFETDNKIVPVALPDVSTKNQFKQRAKSQKARRKTMKKHKKKHASSE
ncbi:NIF domain protein [Talaromyces stipitatus ATCC 10500]|uniref:Mitochondrial import inner membrane translocase subunit TIM50 n=1 Tax=Talaromyces stipitatus (strain ATCC 10500 / CBS 375.48 / QM 6759 / NRRL 1006) TaxID=441959 RepID=B8MSM7_TALSN|nr:NIF domain protein [Talaromyces stipitatus ATCC 10500]EED12464.1 NIF domain protein [Talaromyces stipitatus ATCC 10500]